MDDFAALKQQLTNLMDRVNSNSSHLRDIRHDIMGLHQSHDSMDSQNLSASPSHVNLAFLSHDDGELFFNIFYNRVPWSQSY